MRTVRKLVGGGMRQIGILAAAAIYARLIASNASPKIMKCDSLAEMLANCRRSQLIQVRSRPTWCLPVFPKVLRAAQTHLKDRTLINLDALHIRLVTHLTAGRMKLTLRRRGCFA